MATILTVILTLLTIFCGQSSIEAASISYQLEPGDTISYGGTAELWFVIDQPCTGSMSLRQVDPVSGTVTNWDVGAKTLLANSTTAFYIPKAKFSETGNYTAICFTVSNTVVYPQVYVLVKVKPQVLFVNVSSNTTDTLTSWPSGNYVNYQEVVAQFTDDVSTLFLRVFVGDGYFDGGEMGVFEIDEDALAKVTNDLAATSSSFEIDDNYPSGTVHSYNIQLAAAIANSPMVCSVNVSSAVYMESDFNNSLSNTTVAVHLVYKPHNITTTVSPFLNDRCSFTCKVESACPAYFDTIELKIYDATAALMTSLAFYNTTSNNLVRHLPSDICHYIAQLAITSSTTVTCTAQNSVGSTVATYALNKLPGIDELIASTLTTTTKLVEETTTSSTTTSATDREPETTSDGEWTWWMILITVLCGFFLLLLIIAILMFGCYSKKLKEETKPGSNPPSPRPSKQESAPAVGKDSSQDSSLGSRQGEIGSDGYAVIATNRQNNGDAKIVENAVYGKVVAPSKRGSQTQVAVPSQRNSQNWPPYAGRNSSSYFGVLLEDGIISSIPVRDQVFEQSTPSSPAAPNGTSSHDQADSAAAHRAGDSTNRTSTSSSGASSASSANLAPSDGAAPSAPPKPVSAPERQPSTAYF